MDKNILQDLFRDEPTYVQIVGCFVLEVLAVRYHLFIYDLPCEPGLSIHYELFVVLFTL